jgi:DNA repair protein RadA/Sms
MICFGEVGLTGEVRDVSQIELRMNEAFRLGFRRFVIPKANLKSLANWPQMKQAKIMAIENVRQIARALGDAKTKASATRDRTSHPAEM